MNQMSGYCRPTLFRIIHAQLVVSPGEPDVRLLSAHPLPNIHAQLVVSPGEPDVRLLSAHPLPRHTCSAGGESW